MRGFQMSSLLIGELSVVLPESSCFGHVHCGKDKMAYVGAINANVPPWTIGSLTPNKLCSKVTSPDTKYMVLRTSLMASVLFAKHIGPLIIKGIANVDPNMVKKC